MKKLILAAALLFLSAACATTTVPPKKSADLYYQEGEEFFAKKQYADAIAAWEKVRDSYFSPELNARAELKIAEAHFMAEEYVEAAAAYEDFLKQHPDHEETPQVLYRLGMSYYQQILSADRDQTATNNALATFQSYLKRYPGDSREEEIKVLIERCKLRLAEHELYVGRFYQRSGEAKSAIHRLEGLLATYPAFAKKDQAYFYLGQAYLQAGEREKAVAAFNALYREFPGSKYVPKGQKILEKDY